MKRCEPNSRKSTYATGKEKPIYLGFLDLRFTCRADAEVAGGGRKWQDVARYG
jgi:hypothetical protein